MGLFDKIGSFSEKAFSFANKAADTLGSIASLQNAFNPPSPQPQFNQQSAPAPAGPPLFAPPNFGNFGEGFGPTFFPNGFPPFDAPVEESSEVGAGGLLLIGVATGVIVWFVTRK